MVCRAGTLRFHRKGSNEVMNYSIRQCRIPPAANATAQVVKPTRHRAGLDSRGAGAPSTTAHGRLRHNSHGCCLHLEKMEEFAMWTAQPRPFRILSEPQHAEGSSCPNLSVTLHRFPAHCCSLPS